MLQVTMRVIQGAIAEVKAIQPAATQAVLSLLPSGAQRSLLQVEQESGPGSGASSLLQGQERLHQEGKAALHTLSCTREALQDAMERELQEQREVRECCRAFFRSVMLHNDIGHLISGDLNTGYFTVLCPTSTPTLPCKVS